MVDMFHIPCVIPPPTLPMSSVHHPSPFSPVSRKSPTKSRSTPSAALSAVCLVASSTAPQEPPKPHTRPSASRAHNHQNGHPPLHPPSSPPHILPPKHGRLNP